MPGCILRASGRAFVASAFLARFSIPGAAARGTGLSAVVSERDGDDLVGQTRDAMSFLSANGLALRELVAFSGVDAVVLDFAVWRKDTASQSLHFPPELVAKAGALGLGLEVSVYVAADS